MAPSSAPATRVHFLDEQRRNRRRSLRFAVFAISAVGIAGIPLCVVIAPLLLGGMLVAAHVIDLFTSLSETQWAILHDALFVGPTIYHKLLGHETAISWRALAIVYIAPGSVLMVLTWPLVRLITRRAGVGSLLRHLDSREPDPRHLDEQQTVNVVGEMAVAAGVSPPSVRVIDSSTVNAVAVGLSMDDVTLFVTSGFLEQLDRDERQAVVAHLVGSVGNGDLEIAATIFSVFETWGLVATLLMTPLSSRRRAFVRRFARVAYQAVRGRANEAEARVVVDTLLTGSDPDLDDVEKVLAALQPKSARHGCYLVLVQLPLFAVVGLSTIAARESTNLFTLLVLGPWLAAMWRARRRLADATAVQLTRNPAGLASAVRTLAKCDVEVPGGWTVHFLFPVWVAKSSQSGSEFTTNVVGMRLDPEPRLRQLAALGAPTEDGQRVRLVDRIRAATPNWNELRDAVKWGILATVAVGFLMVVTVLSASLVLIVLWYVLQWLSMLVALMIWPPGRSRGRLNTAP